MSALLERILVPVATDNDTDTQRTLYDELAKWCLDRTWNNRLCNSDIDRGVHKFVLGLRPRDQTEKTAGLKEKTEPDKETVD